ncbi:MAG: cyclase family protein [Candidatus Omnitrophota bacterium]|nr:cyclase family protein [Candidatus Omnitrophota bacterium]
MIIDLSLPIDEKAFEAHPIRIERIDHKQGVKHLNWVLMSKSVLGRIKYFLGQRIIRKTEIPDQEFLSLEMVYAAVHMGTHVDFTYHYGSKSEGKPSKKINDLPLEWCYSDGVVLDFSHKKYPQIISKADITEALRKVNYELKPMDIVLIRTDSDKFFGKKEYLTSYVGMSREATEYLIDQGIKVIGIDTLGLDRPFKDIFRDFQNTRDKNLLYPCHMLGRIKEYAHIERLANLDKLPKQFGFKVICFPIKIKDVGAAWSRVVAVV